MIYLDNAATTAIHPEVLEAMMPYLTDRYGNASANYDLGRESRDAIENARHIIARSINAEDDEIFFTSGGTEADNTIIRALESSVSGIVTTPIEHKAILNSLPNNKPVTYRISDGYEKLSVDHFVEMIPVKQGGCIDLKALEEMPLYNKLITVMYANNETGVIQPVKEIGKYIHQFADLDTAILHTDAVQAYGHIPIDVKEECIDSLSASAHKFHGPKGIGFLYVSKNIVGQMEPLITGGGQEKGLRSGTENVASIVGMGRAAEIAMKNMQHDMADISRKRDRFEEKVLRDVPNVHINGQGVRLPGHSNMTLDRVSGEIVLEFLNSQNICAATGSACASKDSTPSHVLKAMGLSDQQANSSLRFSISAENTMEELDFVVGALVSAFSLFSNYA